MKLKNQDPRENKTDQSLANRLAGEIASTVAQKTAETLITNAKSQLNHLFEQKNQFIEMKSSLDGLIQRYNLNNSYLNQAAFWYGNKSWFNKFGTGALFVAASALIGAVIQLSALFTVLALTLHYAVTFILKNHYEATASQQLMLAEDINKIEARVNVSINAFNKAQIELKQTLKLLSQHNIDMAENAAALETQITTLNEQNSQFKDAIAQLEQLTNSLLANLRAINGGIQKAGDDLQSINNELTQQTLKINGIKNKLSDHEKSVGSRADALVTLNGEWLKNLKQLENLEAIVLQHLNKPHNTDITPKPLKPETNADQKTSHLLARADEALNVSRAYFSGGSCDRLSKNRQQNGFFSNREKPGNTSPVANLAQTTPTIN